MTLKNNRAPLVSIIKLYASFHHHMWIQTGVTVRKRLSWVLTSVNLTFDPWPWPLAWMSLLSLVITPENFMMIQWREHGEKGVTDGQTDRRTDGQTDWTSHIAAWSQLINKKTYNNAPGFEQDCSITSFLRMEIPNLALSHWYHRTKQELEWKLKWEGYLTTCVKKKDITASGESMSTCISDRCI